MGLGTPSTDCGHVFARAPRVFAPQAALRPRQRSKTYLPAHGWFAELVQIFRRPGMEVLLAVRRFQGKEDFKKTVFLYERTRHLYENKEGHVQNEAKTKLKMSCFLAKTAGKNPKMGCFLTKRTQETSPRAV